MVTNRTLMAAMFTFTIATSLVAVSGMIGSGSAFAAKKQTEYGTAPQASLDKDNQYHHYLLLLLLLLHGYTSLKEDLIQVE